MGSPTGWSPEPVEQMRLRYKDAIAFLYDEGVIRAGGIRPGEVAANVFQFEDGLHVIVSKERVKFASEKEQSIVIHVSFSFRRGSKHYRDVESLMNGKTKEQQLSVLSRWAERGILRFCEMSGESRADFELAAWTGGGVPHYFKRLKGET